MDNNRQETYSEIIHCKQCRNDFEATEEFVTYFCPHCRKLNLTGNRVRKSLDIALDIMEKRFPNLINKTGEN